jgi:hypothetical protein
MTEEIYQMPMFPMLTVKDLEAASNFYQYALGFKHIFRDAGSGWSTSTRPPSTTGGFAPGTRQAMDPGARS